MLVELITHRDEQIRQQRIVIKADRQRLTRTMIVERPNPGPDTNADFQIARHGAKDGWLSVQGSFALGLRKSFGNGAAKDLGLVIAEDISRQTVVRCEIELAAAHISSYRRWIASSMAALRDSLDSMVT